MVSAVRVGADPGGKTWRIGVIGKRTWIVERGRCMLAPEQARGGPWRARRSVHLDRCRPGGGHVACAFPLRGSSGGDPAGRADVRRGLSRVERARELE